MPEIANGVKEQSILQWEESGTDDRYGVDTITLTEKIPKSKFPELLRSKFSVHPRFPGMAMSKRSWQREASGFYTVTYQYEGILLELPEATYDLDSTLSEKPIQLHPDFVSVLAGKPSEPKNGAVFIDPATNDRTYSDEIGVFKEFAATVPDLELGEMVKNPKGGIESYEDPAATWTKTSIVTTRPSTLRALNAIEDPDGPNPTLSDRTWKFSAVSYQKRGSIYMVRETWRMSGTGGWDADVYP